MGQNLWLGTLLFCNVEWSNGNADSCNYFCLFTLLLSEYTAPQGHNSVFTRHNDGSFWWQQQQLFFFQPSAFLLVVTKINVSRQLSTGQIWTCLSSPWWATEKECVSSAAAVRRHYWKTFSFFTLRPDSIEYYSTQDDDKWNSRFSCKKTN